MLLSDSRGVDGCTKSRAFNRFNTFDKRVARLAAFENRRVTLMWELDYRSGVKKNFIILQRAIVADVGATRVKATEIYLVLVIDDEAVVDLGKHDAWSFHDDRFIPFVALAHFSVRCWKAMDVDMFLNVIT